MRLYIAGPITLGGTVDPTENAKKFPEAVKLLREKGYITESPIWPGDEKLKHPQIWWIRRGIAQMMKCDGVALLPGWEGSEGVNIEMKVARILAIDCRELEYWIRFCALYTGVKED